MTPTQIDAAATIQAIAEHMVNGSDDRQGEHRKWNPTYIRRQGRRLLAALEQLTEEKEIA